MTVMTDSAAPKQALAQQNAVLARFGHNDGPRLVGLCGPAGSGKSTVAGMFEALCGAHQMALADPIVNMLHSLLADAGVGAEWMTERALKEQPSSIGYSYRHLAQSLGTEWGRLQLDSNLWIRVAHHRLTEAAAYEHHVVVTDIRYPNEAEWLQRLGGTLVRVHRPLARNVRLHSSELHPATLPATETLDNSGSLATLQDQVLALARSLGMAVA